jgi:putative ABC transport system permease protein
MADAFPAITAMRVRDLLEALGNTVTNLVLAIRAASALTLIVAVLVLAGALAAGHRRRIYEAVILKTLGATRMRLICAYAIEYFTLGLATAILGVAAGSAAAAFVIVRIMNLHFVWTPGPLLGCAAGAILATVALGLIGTFKALSQKPAPVLRNL